jgi:hypothetical protein
MDKKTAEEFVKKNRHCDHGHVVWTDDQDNEFGITLRVEDVMEYPTPWEYIAAKALAWYPERTKEEIKSLRLAG